MLTRYELVDKHGRKMDPEIFTKDIPLDFVIKHIRFSYLESLLNEEEMIITLEYNHTAPSGIRPNTMPSRPPEACPAPTKLDW